MHRTSIFVPLIAVAALAAYGAEIPQGAHVLLRMENSINTRTAQEGDFVYLRTASPISMGGQIAVPSGSYVQGVVTESKRSGRVKGRAQLAIRLESLTLESGKVFKFSPHLSSVDSGETGQKVAGQENAIEQAPDTGKDAQRIAIWAGSGAALGGLTDRSWKGAGIGAGAGAAVGLATVLLTRGNEVELRHGATLDVVFDRPVALE
jgi:type IV secretion system protein VirB10